MARHEGCFSSYPGNQDYHRTPRPRGLTSPPPLVLDWPRVPPRPLPGPPRVVGAGTRDGRGSGVANLVDLVVVEGFSMKEVSVVLHTVRFRMESTAPASGGSRT